MRSFVVLCLAGFLAVLPREASASESLSTELVDATRRGDLAEIERLITQEGVSVNATDSQGRNIGHILASDASAVRRTIQPNASGGIDVKDESTSALAGEDVLSVLRRHGLNLNAADKYGVTPLLMAGGVGGSGEMIQRLVRAGADPTFEPASRNATLLSIAALHWNFDSFAALAQAIAERDKAKLSVPAERYGTHTRTVLHELASRSTHAAYDQRRGGIHDHLARIRLLVSLGADLRKKDNRGRTPLQTALSFAGSGNVIPPETLALLQELEGGASATGSAGPSPAQIAEAQRRQSPTLIQPQVIQPPAAGSAAPIELSPEQIAEARAIAARLNPVQIAAVRTSAPQVIATTERKKQAPQQRGASLPTIGPHAACTVSVGFYIYKQLGYQHPKGLHSFPVSVSIRSTSGPGLAMTAAKTATTDQKGFARVEFEFDTPLSAETQSNLLRNGVIPIEGTISYTLRQVPFTRKFQGQCAIGTVPGYTRLRYEQQLPLTPRRTSAQPVGVPAIEAGY